MGAHHSAVPYMGRGSTVDSACQDLTDQLQKHITNSAFVQVSKPLRESALSPRARSPRYPGPFVAMAVVGDGKDHPVTLERIPGAGPKAQHKFSASVTIVG
jgi:hypothetical protein